MRNGRIEMTVDGADSFLLETNTVTNVYRLGGTCRLTMDEVDETA